MLNGVEIHEYWGFVPKEKQPQHICFCIPGKHHFEKVRIWLGSGALHNWTAADFLQKTEDFLEKVV